MGMTMITAEGYHDLTGSELGAHQAILDENSRVLVSYSFTGGADGDFSVYGPVRVIQGSLPKTEYPDVYAMCDDLFDSMKPEN